MLQITTNIRGLEYTSFGISVPLAQFARSTNYYNIKPDFSGEVDLRSNLRIQCVETASLSNPMVTVINSQEKFSSGKSGCSSAANL